VRGSSDTVVSDEMVQAAEIHGIADAVTARFCNTPQHHAHATEASINACVLLRVVRKWFADRNAGAGFGANTPTLGEGHDAYRAFLLRYLDWVHKDASADACLFPVTTYLQLILRHTPMEDWAAAATDPDASPLAFAWAWARKCPGIGRQTADVVVLVAMGRHVNRLMVEAEERRLDAAKNIALTERIWAALRGVVKDCLTGAATGLRASPSDFNSYKRMRIEPADAEELLAIVRNMAQLLKEAGERYAQLLGEKDEGKEREGVVDSIRSRVGFILSKAEPPVPEEVFLAITGLATAGQ
jgi:hypothetical protein